MLHRYIRPILGERVLGRTATSGPSDHVPADDRTRPVGSEGSLRACPGEICDATGMRWRLLLENSADRLKVPQRQRNEMRALTIEQARTLLKAAEGSKVWASTRRRSYDWYAPE
jgi:hypothetical protein